MVKDKRLEDQLDVIEYFRITECLKQQRFIDKEESVDLYISEGYSQQYEKIWYEGIDRDYLKKEMFEYKMIKK